MSGENRMTRVNELIKRELGQLCEEKGIAALGGAFATITSVRVSPDLRQADVSVSVFGDDSARTELMRLLHQQRKTLQAEIGRRVRIKHTPVLRFHDDRTPEQADRVLHILDELDLAPETDDDET